jgi:hypothetical protein
MEQHAQSRVIELLLVEDNPGDVRLTTEALRESTLENYLHVVGNGVDVAGLDPCPDRGGRDADAMGARGFSVRPDEADPGTFNKE